MKKSRVIAAVLVALFAFSACGKKDNADSSASAGTSASADASATANTDPTDAVDPTDNPGNEGTSNYAPRDSDGYRRAASTGSQAIVIAMDDWKKDQFIEAINAFKAQYQNIQVVLEQVNIASNDVMDGKALAGTLPDVIYDMQNPVPSFATKGWLYPLDEFLVDVDVEFQNVPQDAIDWRTYGGKLYALPVKAHMIAITAINLDLMDELNLDMPAVDWSFDDFVEFIKGGTNDQYSGIENLGELGYLSAAHTPDKHNYNYNRSDDSYDLTVAWVDAYNWMQDIKAIPGVVAETLRDPADPYGNADSDYTRKFGEGDIGDGRMAWNMGNVLMLICNSAEQGYFRSLPFNWEYHSYPQDPSIGLRPTIQGTSTVVCSTTRYPDAAFELARWFSYGEEGTIACLQSYNDKDQIDPSSGSLFIMPVTNNQNVLNKFRTCGTVTDGLRYFASQMDNAIHYDLYHLMPNFAAVVDDILSPLGDRLAAGETPSVLAAEASDLATTAMRDYRVQFEADLSAVQAAFDAAR